MSLLLYSEKKKINILLLKHKHRKYLSVLLSSSTLLSICQNALLENIPLKNNRENLEFISINLGNKRCVITNKVTS